MNSIISIEKAHAMYYGDEHDKYKASDYVGKTPYIKETCYHNESVIPAGESARILLNTNGRELGLANLHLSGDWISAEFEVGGQRFEKIYPFMDTNIFWFMQGSRVFPHVRYHNCHINITAGPGGATVSWDEVVAGNYDPDKTTEIYAISRQYNGSERLVGRRMLPLNFNFPVFDLHIKTDKPVKSISLQLNGNILDAPFVYDEQRDWWVATIQDIPADGVPRSSERTINFSRVDSAILHIDHDNESVAVDVWATTSSFVRIMSGLAGLAFVS